MLLSICPGFAANLHLTIVDGAPVDRSGTDDPDAGRGIVFAIRSERLLCRAARRGRGPTIRRGHLGTRPPGTADSGRGLMLKAPSPLAAGGKGAGIVPYTRRIYGRTFRVI